MEFTCCTWEAAGSPSLPRDATAGLNYADKKPNSLCFLFVFSRVLCCSDCPSLSSSFKADVQSSFFDETQVSIPNLNLFHLRGWLRQLLGEQRLLFSMRIYIQLVIHLIQFIHSFIQKCYYHSSSTYHSPIHSSSIHLSSSFCSSTINLAINLFLHL